MRVSFWGGMFVGTDGDPDVSVCNLKKRGGVVGSYLLIIHTREKLNALQKDNLFL